MRRIIFYGDPIDTGIANNDKRIIASLAIRKEFPLNKVNPSERAKAVDTGKVK